MENEKQQRNNGETTRASFTKFPLARMVGSKRSGELLVSGTEGGHHYRSYRRQMDHKKEWRPCLISWCPDMHRWADTVKCALTGATWRQSSGALVNVWSAKRWGDPNAPGVPAQTLVTDRRS